MSKIKNTKKINGEVNGVSMQSTVKVTIVESVSHPRYKKVFTRHKNILAHSDLELSVGDMVELEETKPISKRIRWKVIRKLDK